MKTIDSYWAQGINEVDGWLSFNLLKPLKLINELQAQINIKGNILEVGVHHGKLFIPLALLANEDETAVGIDLFDNQTYNLDKSGCGSYQIVQENIKKYCNESTKIELIAKDSISITTKDKFQLVERLGAFRIISIDGGHTPEHTLNDLLFAQDILQGGGVVIVDDYYSIHWPGVHEGVARYFLGRGLATKLKVFCYTQNKLLLTDFSYHEEYLSAFRDKFEKHPAYKPVTMWGADAVVY